MLDRIWLLAYASASRYPVRNRVIVLLSVKAGLRAGEIANLTWPMVVDPSGEIAPYIELHDVAAKNAPAAGGSHYTMTCGKPWHHSPDPADPAVTERVITIMLADEH